MSIQNAAFVFGTLGFSYPFLKLKLYNFSYNMSIAKNDSEVDFMQSFLQLGIYKVGICISLSWIISAINDNQIVYVKILY